MESITIKVDKGLAQKMEQEMKPLYATKTEFIREAIRDKLKDMEKKRLMEHFKKYFGKAKVKTTYEEERKIREQVGRELAKEWGISLD